MRPSIARVSKQLLDSQFAASRYHTRLYDFGCQ